MIGGVLLLDPFDWWSSEPEGSAFKVIPVIGADAYSLSFESSF